MSEGVELYEPATPTFQERHATVYQEMRDHHPVHRTTDGVYVLTRFDDVWSAVRDWESFSSESVAESRGLLPAVEYMDPPRHTQMRALVSRAFTPRRIAELEAHLRQLAVQALDELESGFDAVRDYALPLPSIMMAELLGVPIEVRERFLPLSEGFLDAADHTELAARFARIYEMFDELLTQRRARPEDDLMSALLDAEVGGVKLTDDEVKGFCFLLLVAGNDTSTTLIGNSIEVLARYPESRAEIAADLSLAPDAIEEILRLESPSQVLPRTAARDLVLHDVTIPAGSRVLLCWGAANLDEREFPEPLRFDIHRVARRHLAFGHGIHFCLGASLARLEARVCLEVLLERWPDYRIDDGRARYISHWARAWRTLPLEAPAQSAANRRDGVDSSDCYG